MSEKENENEKVDYRFVTHDHCFLCEKNAGLLIASTPDIPEMIATRHETHFTISSSDKTLYYFIFSN